MAEFVKPTIVTATPISKSAFGDVVGTQYDCAKTEYAKQLNFHREPYLHMAIFDDFDGKTLNPIWDTVGTWQLDMTGWNSHIYGESVNNVPAVLSFGGRLPFSPVNHLRHEFYFNPSDWSEMTVEIGLRDAAGRYVRIYWDNGTLNADPIHCQTYDGTTQNDHACVYPPENLYSNNEGAIRVRFVNTGDIYTPVYHIIFEYMYMSGGEVIVETLVDFTADIAEIFNWNFEPYVSITGKNETTPKGIRLDYIGTDCNRWSD